MIKHRARVISTVILLAALCPLPGAWAGPPTDQLRDGVDRVLKILKDPELQGEQKADQRRSAVVRAAGGIFDFGEMAKRSLGQHWEQRTPAEREEFRHLFTELIQRSYMSKVDQHRSGTMIFRGERVDGDYAVVETTLPFGQGREMPIDYRMHNTADHWRVYDLSIDGISLVGNYRAQFNKIIRTSSYEALIAKFKSNRAEFSGPSAAPSAEKSSR
jgi:phospholipid transport system substrate-binding protein